MSALILLPLLVLATRAGMQEPSSPPAPPGAEGALDNDVFVPVSEEAGRALAEGDATLVRARAAGLESERGRLLDAAFDLWREALDLAGEGGSVWLDLAPTSERRVAEGVHPAVVRRCIELEASERARWTDRLEPAATRALSDLHDGFPPRDREARLARIAHAFPLTPAAAAAAVELGDLALEAGLRERARGWYAVAELEGGLGAVPGLRTALAARRAALPPAQEPAPGQAEPGGASETWRRASGLTPAGSLAWEEPGRRVSSRTSEERWLRPGGVFLDANRFLVQSASEALVFSLPREGGLELATRFRPSVLLGGPAPAIEAPREPPGWPLLPLADERGVVLVVGQTRGSEANALVAVELLEPRPRLGLDLTLDPLLTPGDARLEWAIVGAERLDGHQGSTPVPELEELGSYEFQPGPVFSAERVVVQARQTESPTGAWILAFDRRDGTLAWKRLLASGADRVATRRFAGASTRVAGQPLLGFSSEGEPRVFAGTHLGLGVLVDGLAGVPLWSLKNRRRDEHEPGWSGDRPCLGPLGEAGRVLLWAPMDSDRLYPLRIDPIAGRQGDEASSVLARPPAPLGDASALLGGGADEWIVLASAGKEHTVSARRRGVDRVDALDLRQGEHFRGQGLVSAERVWLATDSDLYLFDRTRELYLLDVAGLPAAGEEPRGGDLFARGDDVLVVGSGALWRFRAR